MSNNQNTILDEDKREYLDEHPLENLFHIVGDMLGRTPTAKEVGILCSFLKEFNNYLAEQYKRGLTKPIE